MGVIIKRQFKKTNISVDTDGNVWGSRGSILKPQLAKEGYYKVSTWEEGKGRVRQIHRLVAETFIPNPNGYKEVNHKNGDKTDNRVENLEWCNRQMNVDHYWQNRR